jgi:hypothetical protein
LPKTSNSPETIKLDDRFASEFSFLLADFKDTKKYA